MKKCYTVSGINSIEKHKDFDIVQYTMNGRIFPSKRNDVQHIRDLRRKGINTKVIIHWDFIYIASRYYFLSNQVKEAIMNKVVELINYADNEDPNILGIVMHTDWPIKKEVMNSEFKDEAIKEEYKSSLWNQEALSNFIITPGLVLKISLLNFANELRERVGSCKCKVYFENTTKVGPSGEGCVDSLLEVFSLEPSIKDVCGIVYDTEHDYAVTGQVFRDVTIFQDKGIDVIVHLNAIPKEVRAKSKKDRHSFTTLLECSQNSLNDYINYINYLDRYNIPWVREIKEETIEREIEQLWN